MSKTNPKRGLALALLLPALTLGPACSDDSGGNATPDKGTTKLDKGATPDAGAKDTGTTGDGTKADAASTAVVITKMIPSDGFSNGGKTGAGTPVLLTGKNFAQGATVYIDGQPQALTIGVNSAVSMTFTMPPNPYDTKKPGYVDVMIKVGNQFSNTVRFDYTVTQAMSSTFKGSVLTSSMEAFTDFPTPKSYEAKVYVDGVTDKQATASTKIKADIGYGKKGTDPSQDLGWRWEKARFDQQSGTYHQYSATLTVPLAQTYDVAFRFSYDEKGWNQFGYYIYADTDETDLSYSTTKAATVTATAAPTGYCLADSDCYDSLNRVCKLSSSSWKLHKCVHCLKDADCAANKDAYGNKCLTTTNLCSCSADTDCTGKNLGYVCANKTSSGGVCGCTKDTNCPPGLKCLQTQSGATICGVPSP